MDAVVQGFFFSSSPLLLEGGKQTQHNNASIERKITKERHKKAVIKHK
jgi:hypothetical protein